MPLTKAHNRMIADAVFNIKDFGAVGDGIADDTAAIQAAIDATPAGGGTVYVPTGLYLIDPAVSIIVKTGLTIFGDGREASQLVAKPVGGAVIKRQRSTTGPNARISAVKICDLGIILRHPTTADPSNYYQIGIDYHSIGRSYIERVYIGNYTGGASSALPSPAVQLDGRQGYGVVISSTSSGDPAYAGGEVNTLRDVFIAGVRYGITIDDPTFYNPGYSSAAYRTMVDNCEVQIAEVGIAQWSQFGAGCTFANNTIQSIANMRGSSDTTYGIYIRGYENLVYGGYNESPSVDFELFLQTNSQRNRILPFLSDTGTIQDDGTANVFEKIDSSTNKYTVTVNGKDDRSRLLRAWVKFNWDGAAIVISDSYNISGVARIGTGDYRVDFLSGVMADANYAVSIAGSVNASAHEGYGYIRTAAGQTAANCRITTYDAVGAAAADFTTVTVNFFAN